MTTTNEEIFAYDGKQFKIRTATNGNQHCVKAFLNEAVVSITYCVDYEVLQDYFSIHRESLVKKLVSIVKSDIEEGKYLKT